MNKKVDLDNISEEDLLNARVCDLPVEIKGTWLEGCVQQLYSELEAKGLAFKPECYLADEWLTPQNETCIGIPFYLAHPVLLRLEKKFMIDAEGETKDWCMKLLRHEAGHAICYAYRFHRRQTWKKTFGPYSAEYKETYKYRPYSKNYVRHLDGYYAQYHPEEDFVETFAVWLTPDMDWMQQYKGWKALEKLNYVEHLMAEIKAKPPLVKSSRKFWQASAMTMKLTRFYQNKRKYWAEDFPDFYDPFLRRVFVEKSEEDKGLVMAADIIQKFRKNIIKSVSAYSGEKKYIISDLLKRIQTRSKELNLYARDEESVVALHLNGYITSLVMNYLYTGRFRGEKKRIREIL